MSMNVWQELGTPDYPLNEERTDRIRQGARLGMTAVELFGDQSDAAVLAHAIHKVSTVIQLSPDGITGLCVGVRAGRLDLDLSQRDSDGYWIDDDHEVEQVEFAKITGAYDAAFSKGKDSVSLFQDALKTAENGASPFYQAADFLGYTFGIHYDLQLQGVGL